MKQLYYLLALLSFTIIPAGIGYLIDNPYFYESATGAFLHLFVVTAIGLVGAIFFAVKGISED